MVYSGFFCELKCDEKISYSFLIDIIIQVFIKVICSVQLQFTYFVLLSSDSKQIDHFFNHSFKPYIGLIGR